MRTSWVSACMMLGVMGCATPPGGLDSPVPSERLKAIARAAREKDQNAVPTLIGFLNSDDPAVRLASIRALEAITGQMLGYEHAAPESQRQEAIDRWVEWDNQRRTPPSSPEQPDRTSGTRGEGIPPGSAPGSRGRNADTVW